MTSDRDSSQIESKAMAEFAAYVDRLLAGETLDLETIQEQHPEFGNELIEQLRTFQEMAGADQSEPQVTKLGDYALLGKLGSGGMGVVYEAWQDSLNRHVALKLLPKVSSDTRAIARFIREAQASAQLNHPHIVSIFDMGVEQGTLYYTMEMVSGETLSHLLSNYGEPQNETGPQEINLRHCLDMATAFAGVAEGLQHAHARGVIHRDIKPANLIFDTSQNSNELPKGILRILDFGLAQIENQDTLTVSGALIGTVRYMSPEQSAARSVRIDHRSDIYSLGATLYEAITLHPPFAGVDLQDTLSKIRDTDAPRPSQLNPRVPRDLETIVLKCMRKSPADRYQSAEALSQDLKRFARGDLIEARPQSRIEKLSRWGWKHRWRLTSAAVILVASCFAWWFASKWQATEATLRANRYEPTVREAIRLLRRTERAMFSRSPYELSIYPWGYARYLPKDSEVYSCFVKECSTISLNLALSHLNNAIRLQPDRADAYWHRARVHLLLDDWQAAQEDLQIVAEKQPGNVASLFLLSTIEDLHGDKDASEELWERALRIAEQNATGWQQSWLAAQRFSQMYKWSDAERAYSETLSAAKDLHGEAWEPYTGWELEVRHGRQICMELSERYLPALMELSVLLDKWPDALDLQVSRGLLQYTVDRQEGGSPGINDGLALLERLYNAELEETKQDEIAERVCLQHGLLVDTHHKQLDSELVNTWMNRIHDLQTRAFVEFRMRLLQSDKPGAIEVIDDASERFADSPWFPLARAGITWLDAAATEAVEEAVRRDPTCSYAHITRAFRRANRSFLDPEDKTKRRLAEQALREARKCDLNLTWERIYLAYSVGLLGDIEQANRLFDDLSKRDPYPWIEHNRGEMLRRVAQAADTAPKVRRSLLDQSIRAQDIAVEVDPDMSSFLWQKMLVLMELEDFDEIDRFYKRIKSRGIPQRNVEIAAGIAYLNSHRHADSISAFGSALELRAEVWLYNQLRDVLRLSNAEEVRERAVELARTVERVLSDRSEQQHLPHELLLLFDAYQTAGDRENARRAAVRLIRSCRNIDTCREPTRSVLQQARDYIEPNLVTIGCIDNKLVDATEDCDSVLGPFLTMDSHIDDNELPLRREYAQTLCAMNSGKSDEGVAALQALARSHNAPNLTAALANQMSEHNVEAALNLIGSALERHPSHQKLQAAYWNAIHKDDTSKTPDSVSLSGGLEQLSSLDWVINGTEVADRFAQDGVIRINCGADIDMNVDGELWLADRHYDGADFSEGTQVVVTGQLEAVYSTLRKFWDPSQAAYRIPLANGRFDVKLHFVETYEYHNRADGKRSFDVLVEDTKIETNLEIVGKADFATPLVIEDSCTVTDGVLDVEFVQHRSCPVLFGIEVARD